MSSLFSDPPFPRGTTLLQGEAIELMDGMPIAGAEVAGTLKALPDVVPGTGPAAVRRSNRLVYCLAARYVGTTTINVAGADRGRWYVIDRSNPLGAQFNTAAAATDILAGRIVGVLDEHLTTEVRPNDIVWLVIGGPTSALKAANSVISNAGVEISSGTTVVLATQANRVGTVADPSGTVSVTTASGTGNDTASIVISTTIANYALLAVGNHLSGVNVPTGSTIRTVSNLAVSGTTVTATLGVGGNVTTSIATGTNNVTITNQSYTGTLMRVMVDCNVV